MAVDQWRAFLPRAVRALPADLAAVVLLTGATWLVVFLPVVNDSPIRVALGLPLVLFVPGYAFVAALFPEAGDGPDPAADTDPDEDPDSAYAVPEEEVGWDRPDAEPADRVADRSAGIDGIERVALSFGTSIAIVPLIGLVLNFTPFGIRLVPIMASVTLFTLAASVVAASRRWALPVEERFRVPYREWIAAARTELLEPDDRADAALNVLLVLSIVIATASVGYAVIVPKDGEAFTELYLLTEGEDGALVADDYPTEFVRGDPQSLVVGVGNHEHRPVNYSLVVELQRVQVRNNSTTVLEEDRLRAWQFRVADNRTVTRNHSIAPTLTGQRLRLAYLLYRGQPPADPTVENAYREVHLWINVSAPSASMSVPDAPVPAQPTV
jgi:uncharacterized membrane protein